MPALPGRCPSHAIGIRPPRLNVVGGCTRSRASISVSRSTSTSVVVLQATAGFGLTANRMACGALVLALLNRSAIAVSRDGAGMVSVQASISNPPTGCVVENPAGARISAENRPDGGRVDALVNDVAIQRSPSVHGDCAISRFVDPL